jgi:hypothetical protein
MISESSLEPLRSSKNDRKSIDAGQTNANTQQDENRERIPIVGEVLAAADLLIVSLHIVDLAAGRPSDDFLNLDK